MFKKIEAFMNKHLVPFAHKVDKQRHLSAIKKSMVAMTPLIMIGSLCLIPEAIPNLIGAENPISVWIMANLETIYLPFTYGMGMMSLYVAASIAYNLGKSYNMNIPGCLSMGIVAFLLVTLYNDPETGALSVKYLSTKGLIMGMLAPMIAVELYRWCLNKKFTIKMPEGVPDFVSSSFEMIPVSLIVIGSFLAFRLFSVNVLGCMPPEILTPVLAPLLGALDHPLGFFVNQFLSCLLFFFGIHPSVMSPITSPISNQFLAENQAAHMAGQALPHFYTGGMVSPFANFTGTGITVGLVVWCLLSKAKSQKTVGRVSLLPTLFGINEPILFGAPIVLNPIFFIPYVIGGSILGSIPAFMMHYGLLNKSWFNPPYVGVFLEGFLATGDWMAIVANLIQLIGSIIIWYPFFKIFEKEELKAEKKAEETTSAISAEDEALLDDLDLDF